MNTILVISLKHENLQGIISRLLKASTAAQILSWEKASVISCFSSSVSEEIVSEVWSSPCSYTRPQLSFGCMLKSPDAVSSHQRGSSPCSAACCCPSPPQRTCPSRQPAAHAAPTEKERWSHVLRSVSGWSAVSFMHLSLLYLFIEALEKVQVFQGCC